MLTGQFPLQIKAATNEPGADAVVKTAIKVIATDLLKLFSIHPEKDLREIAPKLLNSIEAKDNLGSARFLAKYDSENNKIYISSDALNELLNKYEINTGLTSNIEERRNETLAKLAVVAEKLFPIISHEIRHAADDAAIKQLIGKQYEAAWIKEYETSGEISAVRAKAVLKADSEISEPLTRIEKNFRGYQNLGCSGLFKVKESISQRYSSSYELLPDGLSENSVDEEFDERLERSLQLQQRIKEQIKVTPVTDPRFEKLKNILGYSEAEHRQFSTSASWATDPEKVNLIKKYYRDRQGAFSEENPPNKCQ